MPVSERGKKSAAPVGADAAADGSDAVVSNLQPNSTAYSQARASDYRGAAVWHNVDHDEPVTVTGCNAHDDGLLYFTIAESRTGIPEPELWAADGKLPLTPYGHADLFVRTIYSGEPPGWLPVFSAWVAGSKKRTATVWHRADDLDGVVKTIMRETAKAGRNVYAPVGLQRARLDPYHRGEAATVGALVGLWGDFPSRLHQ